MIKEIAILTLMSSIPLVELKIAAPIAILTGSVALPYGTSISGLGLNPLIVLGVVIFTNIILGILSFNFLHSFDEKLKNAKYSRHYIRILEKNQRKMKKKIDKYGIFGLIAFISVPFPGSGVCTGSLGAFVTGMRKRDFYLANAIGVLISASVVTALTVFGGDILVF